MALLAPANHGAYSIPGTQVRAQKKNFGTASQTDLARSLVPFVVSRVVLPPSSILRVILARLNCKKDNWGQSANVTKSLVKRGWLYYKGCRSSG